MPERCNRCWEADCAGDCGFPVKPRYPNEAEAALYRALNKALESVRDGDTDTAEEHLLDALDGIYGFCHPRFRVFPDVDFRELEFE